jgi:hypothetical protein
MFGNRPDVIGDSGFHRGGNAKTGMHSAEIVVREVQRDSGFQIQQFLAESTRQAREAADRHTHREIPPRNDDTHVLDFQNDPHFSVLSDCQVWPAVVGST